MAAIFIHVINILDKEDDCENKGENSEISMHEFLCYECVFHL